MSKVSQRSPSDAGRLGPRLTILAVALLFSTGGAAIKATSLDGWQVASFRSGTAALVVLLFLPAARRGFARARASSTLSLLTGVASVYAVTLVLFVVSNKLTTAASSIFLQSTAPLWVLLLAPLLLAERIRRVDVSYMVVLAGGFVLFFLGVDPAQATAPAPFKGNLLAAAAGLTWALTILGLRGLESGGRSGSAAAVVLGNALACLATLPAALPVAGATGADWAVLAYLGVFQIGLAYIFLTRAIGQVGAFEVSLLLLAEPVLSPVWSFLLHGETPGAFSLAGGGVILVATAVKTVWDSRSRRPSPATPG